MWEWERGKIPACEESEESESDAKQNVSRDKNPESSQGIFINQRCELEDIHKNNRTLSTAQCRVEHYGEQNVKHREGEPNGEQQNVKHCSPWSRTLW
ncbi:hypothetical protein DPEC_G00325770 [Dallia pectoralis]|uniref:Uncharacterized protein n=1 Tax=Dallia pectoralis TaxID=75939 RepID=A0ACC2F7N3_DALPE|nr:hypothetical protein DPEC_G00325770 [Dallia pectoralis]